MTAEVDPLVAALDAMPKNRGHRYELRWVYQGDTDTTIHRANASSRLILKELLRDTLASGRVSYFAIHVDGAQFYERFVTGTTEVRIRLGNGGTVTLWV